MPEAPPHASAAPIAPAPGASEHGAQEQLADSVVGPQDQLVDRLIFERDVNEGFLLIDYISGRTEKSLKDLDVDELEIPAESSSVTQGQAPTAIPSQTPQTASSPTATVTPSRVLQKFCEIRYPPVREPRIRAENAAFVLEVKDRLNALARPARGITVAYTAIFVGNAAFGKKPNGQQQTLLDQAVGAAPNIAWHARLFARLFGLVLPLFLLFWFLLTAVTYWDVAYGGSIVQTLQQLDTQRTSLLQPGAQGSSAAVTVTPEICKALKPDGSDPPDRRGACFKLGHIETDMAGARANLREFHDWLTRGLSWYDIIPYVRPMRWGFLAYHPTLYDDSPEQSITWVLTLFGTYVLPAMFGLLGTMAAVVRAVLAKVRDSLLGPRDLSLSLLGLVIGPLAGLAVGLFYTPSATAAQSTTGLAGTVTLTVSGLGFLAGYGADAFFKFLDALLVRVFALEDGKSGK
jgi:hypothetical protein